MTFGAHFVFFRGPKIDGHFEVDSEGQQPPSIGGGQTGTGGAPPLNFQVG